MKVAVVGTGYVGLVQAVGLAELGHHVIGIDVDKKKIAALSNGKSPIYEPELDELLTKHLATKQLTFTTELATAIIDCQIVFIAVGTPGREDRRPDLRYVESAATDIAHALSAPIIVATKSTVPVGTGKRVSKILQKYSPHRATVVSNPEFLREGTAVRDFFKPDRIVVGTATDNDEVRAIMEELYAKLTCPRFYTDLQTAELSKYASNAMLATQISFINSIAQLSEIVGANVQDIATILRNDKRIGQDAFLNAGIGYGGSCFPKDIDGLITMAHDAGAHNALLEAVRDVNEAQRHWAIRRTLELIPNINESTIAIWGLAFKANTDDIRQAPAITIIDSLISKGATVHAYDPVAMPNASKVFGDATCSTDPISAAKDADLILILTDWPEFRDVDLSRVRDLMRTPQIIDGRNMFKPEEMKCLGFTYYSVGRPPVGVDKAPYEQ